jgi:hypothetical protein
MKPRSGTLNGNKYIIMIEFEDIEGWQLRCGGLSVCLYVVAPDADSFVGEAFRPGSVLLQLEPDQ